MEPASPLQDYAALSEQVFVRPADPAATAKPGDPDVVILYGWGDARLKHVAKYAEGYIALYPGAKLVLILSGMVKALSVSLEARAHAMMPVVHAVFGATPEAADPPPRVLVHAMSNTGGISLAATMYAYKELYCGPEKTLPMELMVLDSTPGTHKLMDNVGPWSRALALALAPRFPWPFFVTQGLAAAFLGAVFFANWVSGNATAAEFSTLAVNNPDLSDPDAKRLYLYSKADDLIPWQAIENHGAGAREKGFDVSFQPFEGSPHVGHMKLHPEQYWNSIRSAWAAQAGNHL